MVGFFAAVGGSKRSCVRVREGWSDDVLICMLPSFAALAPRPPLIADAQLSFKIAVGTEL